MSTLFRCPPSAFVKHDDLKLSVANNVTTGVEGAGQKLEQKCNSPAITDASSVLLRDDHIVLLTIDALLALRASFKKWRNHRRTLRALAELDETQLSNLSERGLQVRREARRAMHHPSLK
jgi:uncharacterized protein YjiS (DUF1127 family)